MRSRAGRLLGRLEHQRQTMLAEIGALAPEQLAFRPAAESWSVLDVVEHLVKVEEGIASRIKKREPRTWAEAARARLALELMSVYFVLGRRFKVPSQAVQPQGGTKLATLGSRWEAAQQALRRAIDGFGSADFARPMMRHPILGLLTPVETLSFIVRHIAHHRRQIARIRRSPVYPRF